MNIPSTRTGILITSYCRLLVKDCKKGVTRKEEENMEEISMQLLKSETPIKAQCNKDIIERIKVYATDKHDIKYQHTTTARGYVKRNKNIAYLCLYKGRFGIGITYYTENYMSTNYCFKTTISWEDMTIPEMFTILRKAFREFYEDVNWPFIIKVVGQKYEL